MSKVNLTKVPATRFTCFFENELNWIQTGVFVQFDADNLLKHRSSPNRYASDFRMYTFCTNNYDLSRSETIRLRVVALSNDVLRPPSVGWYGDAVSRGK